LHHECILGMGGILEAKKKEKPTLEKGGKLAELRKKFPNAGRPWSKEDSDDMVVRFEKGETESALGKHFGRKPSAIHARLVQLGVIEDPEWTAREEARKEAKEKVKSEKKGKKLESVF
jgi:hypothetical protein